MLEPANIVLTRMLQQVGGYVPNLVAGILILCIGILSAAIVRNIVYSMFHFLKIDAVLQKMHLMQRQEVVLWSEIVSEIVRWAIIIMFLAPTMETLGLSRATAALNQLLIYIPNVLIAVIILFVGLAMANLVHDSVVQIAGKLGDEGAHSIGMTGKYAVVFITILVALNQLGVAQDLIRIFFTGLVAMIAIAGGLAFGLGGKEMAAEILQKMKQNLTKK